MLKTSSPVIATSTGGSPSTFRRAQATPSPRSSAHQLSTTFAAARSRPSSKTCATPPDSAPAPACATRHRHVSCSPQTVTASSDPPEPQPAQHLTNTSQVRDHESSTVMSPNKRPGSPTTGPTSPAQADLLASSSATTAPKRARTEAEPPKVLPQRYEFCDVGDIVELVAHMLAELIATNDAIPISSGGLTRFHSRAAPTISVRDYLHRLARHATLTPPLLLAMVYYIDRLCNLYPDFTINTLTVHRFLITAATVAAKGLSDSFWNNTTYARIGGVRVAELKLLELDFLCRVDWKIVPNPEVLVAYYHGLVERTPHYTLEPGGDGSENVDLEDEDVDVDEEDDDDEDDVGDGDEITQLGESSRKG